MDEIEARQILREKQVVVDPMDTRGYVEIVHFLGLAEVEEIASDAPTPGVEGAVIDSIDTAPNNGPLHQ